MIHIVKVFMPVLAVLLKHLVTQNSLAAANMMTSILRAYCMLTKSTNAVEIEISPQFLLGWFALIKQLIDKKLPEGSTGLEPRGQPTDPEERDKWKWWKLKKWALRAVTQMFNASMKRKAKVAKPEDEHEPSAVLALTFINRIAPQVLKSVLGVLALRSHREYCPDSVLDGALKFLEPSLEAGNVYSILKPHMPGLIFQVLFGLLCFSDKVWAAWKESPEDFVSREFEIVDDCVDLRASASMLISDAVKLRPSLYQGTLQGVVDGWKKLAGLPPSAAKMYQEYGLLSIFTALHESNISTTDPRSKAVVEQLLSKCVQPQLRNPHAPFMRRYACVAVSRHASFEFSHPHLYQISVQGVLLNLRAGAEQELPVRVEAACALQSFLDQEIAHEVVRPILKEILQALFAMMDMIPIDEVVTTLESIIRNFGEDLNTLCGSLVQKLLQVFKTYTVRSKTEENDVAAMAAYACIECVSTLFRKMEKFPDVYPQLEPIVTPFLHNVLSADGELIEFLEHGLRIIAWSALCSPAVSPAMWELYPKIYNAYRFFAHDYLETMVTVFEAFISRGTSTFVSVPQVSSVKIRLTSIENMCPTFFSMTCGVFSCFFVVSTSDNAHCGVQLHDREEADV